MRYGVKDSVVVDKSLVKCDKHLLVGCIGVLVAALTRIAWIQVLVGGPSSPIKEIAYIGAFYQELGMIPLELVNYLLFLCQIGD